MTNKKKLIVLAGCLAAGKTTLSREIFNRFPALGIASEDIGGHEIFQSWIRHEHSRGMLTQLEFYIRSVELLMCTARSQATIVLSDFSIDIHHWVYSSTLHSSKIISDKEWQICGDVYLHVDALIRSRFDVFPIGLRVSEATLTHRLQERMRDSGDSISKDTIMAYSIAFERWLTSNPHVLILEEDEVNQFMQGNKEMINLFAEILGEII